MKFRKIDSINNKPLTSRADIVDKNIKNINDIGGNYQEFLDNSQPMVCTWYHIDQANSHKGIGYNDTAGPYEGGIKYIIIHNYRCYGYKDERAVDLEEGEHLDLRYKLEELTFIHLPNSLKPYPGDRLSLQVEDHRFLYKVTSSNIVNFNNQPFIRTEVTKDNIKSSDYYEEDFIRDGLITDIVEYVPSNLNTNAKPFMRKADIDLVDTVKAYKEDLNEQYNDYFYDDYKNIYATTDPLHKGMLTYTPLLVDLQMEFRTLWTYGINTILTHETLVNKRNKYSYKKNIIRRFLNKIPGAWQELKDNGCKFSGYRYVNNMAAPTYKVQSYLNDNISYYIYDYYTGDNIFLDDQGNEICRMVIEDKIEIPAKIHDLCQKYSDGTLTLDYLKTFLEDFDFEMCFCCMLMVFMVLTIVDKAITDYTARPDNIDILI